MSTKKHTHQLAYVERERGWTQVRWYPACTVCGWYPLHSSTQHEAVVEASAHNKAKHPGGGQVVVVDGVDVYKAQLKDKIRKDKQKGAA